MTLPMANPTPRALKHRSLEPVPITRATKKRGANAAPKISEARAATKSMNSAASASEIDPDKPLTEKQRQFVKFWAQGDSITNAEMRAGFAGPGIGYRMVRAPNILKAYNAEKALYEEAAQITRKSVMDMHLEAFEMAKLMSEPSTMVAAARELVLDRMNQMTDAELLAVISKGATQALTYVTDISDADSSGD